MDLHRLGALRPLWIEHKAEHAAEFRSRATRAWAAGQEDVAKEIDAAAKELDWVNEALTTARNKPSAPA